MEFYGGLDHLRSELSAADSASLFQGVSFVSHLEKSWPAPAEPLSSVLVAQDLEAEQIVKKIVALGVHHVVQKNHRGLAEECRVAAQMISRDESFFSHPENFFEDLGEKERVERFPFHSSRQKPQLLENVLKWMERQEGFRGAHDLILMMVDEMVTNALYNAPTNPQGAHLYRDWSRNKAVQIDSQRPAFVFLRVSKNWVTYGCKDSFGSLVVSDLLQHLLSTYTADQMMEVRHTGVGGGLGLRLIMENSTCFHFGVQPGRATVFVGRLPIGLSLKKSMQIEKSLHIFL